MWIGARRGALAAPDLGAWAEAQGGLRLLGMKQQSWLVRVHSTATMQYRALVMALEKI